MVIGYYYRFAYSTPHLSERAYGRRIQELAQPEEEPIFDTLNINKTHIPPQPPEPAFHIRVCWMRILASFWCRYIEGKKHRLLILYPSEKWDGMICYERDKMQYRNIPFKLHCIFSLFTHTPSRYYSFAYIASGSLSVYVCVGVGVFFSPIFVITPSHSTTGALLSCCTTPSTSDPQTITLRWTDRSFALRASFILSSLLSFWSIRRSIQRKTLFNLSYFFVHSKAFLLLLTPWFASIHFRTYVWECAFMYSG